MLSFWVQRRNHLLDAPRFLSSARSLSIHDAQKQYYVYIYMLDFVIQGYWQHISKLYLFFSHRRRACITILLAAMRDESNTITICDCDAIEITTVPSSSPTRHSDFDMLLCWRWFYHTFSFFGFFFRLDKFPVCVVINEPYSLWKNVQESPIICWRASRVLRY